MTKPCVFLALGLLIASPVSASVTSFPEVDSILDTRVHRYTRELGNLSKPLGDFQASIEQGIHLSSDLSEFALFNFQNMFEARKHFSEAARKECGVYVVDTTTNLFEVGVRIGWAVGYSLAKIDQNIQTIEKLIALLDQDALIQAARDLLNAWKDILDFILRKYPYLKDMKDMAVEDRSLGQSRR